MKQQNLIKSAKARVTGTIVLNIFHIVMTRFPIPENCSAHVPMILKEFCSSKINGLVMKTFSGK